MDSFPTSKRARTDDSFSSGLSPFDRKRIFDKIYKGDPSFDENDELFKKTSKELRDEKSKYSLYELKLRAKEEALKVEVEEKKAEIETRRAKIKAQKIREETDIKSAKFYDAKKQVFIHTGADVSDDQIYKDLVSNICHAIGFDLVNAVENKLNDKQKIKAARIITEFTGKKHNICLDILKLLNLENVEFRNCIIPRKIEGNPHLPSTMNASIQKKAVEGNNYHVFAYPHEIPKHFPVMFCHPVFATFADILHDRIDKESQTFKDYEKLIDYEDEDGLIRNKIDKCVSHFVEVVLNSGDGENEGESSRETHFVKEVAAALQLLFPSNAVKVEVPIKFGTNASTSISAVNTGNNNSMIPPRMDAVVQINKFPYILLEAKKNNYSINAALQGLQYYGLSEGGYIDNDPSFLITIDKGILFIYGVAAVNRRVVCSCLLSLEFTSFFFNMEGFMEKLWKSFSALYFFYKKFESRIRTKSQDPQHLEYSLFKTCTSFHNQPHPAIFSVKAKDDPSRSIKITFQNVIQKVEETKDVVEESESTDLVEESESKDVVEESKSKNLVEYGSVSFKPCVYLVETYDSFNKYAVLKLARNYDIEAHEQMASVGLAPKIIGHETLCGGQFQIILMEYFGVGDYYDTLHDYIEKFGITDCDNIVQKLENIIEKLKEFGFVHGDFRSTNIVVKRSSDNHEILEDFKLIDFEYSGKVGTLYPNLSFLNRRDIKWPKGFNSYSPRKFEHDVFMFEKLKKDELTL